MRKRVGIWVRVSTDRQAEGDSPEHHEKRGRLYAELQGWEIVEIYHLEALTGKSIAEYSETHRMLKDIRTGHIDGLIFSKLARLARNTRELLDLADFFMKHGADMVSLEEKIDTSSPAGRFFYTVIGALGQWEREEAASRVAASVPIRAKLGKPLGGEIPYGYRRNDNKEIELDPVEAPIRKLIYELFAEHKRKKIVVDILNERGYRTRRGAFTDTTIERLLKDPIAIGQRRINYTKSLGDKKHWELKPKEDWVFVSVPRLISDELWKQCQKILNDMNQGQSKVRRRGVHLFTGKVTCHCGERMYMRSLSPKYICYSCKNKIEPDILEEVFAEQLNLFLFSDIEIQKRLNQDKQMIEDKKELLNALQVKQQKIKERISRVFELYYDNKLSKDAFEDEHSPLYNQYKQGEAEIIQIQAEIDMLSFNALSSDQVLYDAQNLSRQWNTLSREDKKSIIEIVVKNIIVGTDEIEIEVAYLPTLPSTPSSTSSSSGGGGSSNFSPFSPPIDSYCSPSSGTHFAAPYGARTSTYHPYLQRNQYSFEFLQICNATLSLWLLYPPGQGMFMRIRCSSAIS